MKNFNERSRAAYDRKADGYDESREGRFTRNFQRLLLSEMKWRENDCVLDIACGTGSLLAAINGRTGIRGFGVDISERMIMNASVKNPGMAFQVSGCESIPFQSGTMDIVVVCAAYHHFPDVKAFAAESERLLKRHGKIYVAELHIPSFIRVPLNPFVPAIFKDGDVRLYSPAEIVRNFAKFGFYEPNVKIAAGIQIVSMRKA